MENVLLVINCLMTIFNTVLLIAIAGTMARMLRYTTNQKEASGPPENNRLLDLPNRQPSYADLAMPNYDGVRPRSPNSDGIEIIDRA